MSELSVLAHQVAEATRALPAAVRRHVAVTPLIRLLAASESCDAGILLKCEHQQKTGSFKVRGALAKLWSLSDDERRRGVIAASTGNHGLGVAHALAALGGTGIVCAPEGASPVKVAAIRRYGVEVRVLVEGSAAVAIAAGLKTGRTRPGQTIVIVSCGANIASDALAEAIAPPREDGAGPPGPRAGRPGLARPF